MLTKDILFGMNMLTLVGLIMTGFGLTLRRTARAGLPFSVGLMCAGTALAVCERSVAVTAPDLSV
jgi:hypothetical protein